MNAFLEPQSFPFPVSQFPQVSQRTLEKYQCSEGLWLRPFGIGYDDLKIHFNFSTIPRLAVKVIRTCTIQNRAHSVDEAFFLDMSIAKRIECLFRILNLSLPPQSSFTVLLTCSDSLCQKKMEVELSLDKLEKGTEETRNLDIVEILLSDRKFQFRRPNGFDQLELMNGEYENYEAAETALLRNLLVADKDEINPSCHLVLTDESRQLLSAAMTKFDPLVNFSIPINCPYCGREDSYEVNLEQVALEKIAVIQQRLIEAIHKMALHYHWSEETIASLPEWRRLRYLALIREGGESG